MKNKEELGELLNIISSSIGSLTNPEKLKNTFKSEKKSKISSQTIKKYIDYLKIHSLLNQPIDMILREKRIKLHQRNIIFLI